MGIALVYLFKIAYLLNGAYPTVFLGYLLPSYPIDLYLEHGIQ